MLLDGTAAMLHGNVKAHEGCNKVRAEVVLKTRLLDPHPFPAEAKEEPYVAEQILPGHFLQGRPLPIQLNGSGDPCLELCQLLADDHCICKVRLELRQSIPLPGCWSRDWRLRQGARQRKGDKHGGGFRV